MIPNKGSDISCLYKTYHCYSLCSLHIPVYSWEDCRRNQVYMSKMVLHQYRGILHSIHKARERMDSLAAFESVVFQEVSNKPRRDRQCNLACKNKWDCDL